MKIQVVIEATSIQEYTEAIQALAAGYTVAPQQVTTDVLVKPEAVTTYAKAKQAVEQDTVKVESKKEVKADKPKKEEKVAAPKAVEQVFSESSDTSESDEKAVPKHGFPAVKLIASKLSKITDGKAEVKFLLDKFGAKKLSDLKEENYDEFHELASNAIAEHDKVQELNTQANEEVEKMAKEDKPAKETKAEDSGEKEVTLPLIRGIAKQLADQGFKDEIRQVLKDHGAASLTKINKKDYQSVYDALVAYNG